MAKTHIIQLGYKPFRKGDQSRTVFINDSTAKLFLSNTGLGLDLSAKLAQQWFFEVANTYPIVAEKITAALNDLDHKDFVLATSLEAADDGKSFALGLALSFNSLLNHLKQLGCITVDETILIDHKEKDAGVLYIVNFLETGV